MPFYEGGTTEMAIYAIAKPSAYVVSKEEARKIQEEKPDTKKFKEIMTSAERFERLCIKKK